MMRQILIAVSLFSSGTVQCFAAQAGVPTSTATPVTVPQKPVFGAPAPDSATTVPAQAPATVGAPAPVTVQPPPVVLINTPAPVSVGAPTGGTLAAPIAYDNPGVKAMPMEIVVADNPACHFFGFMIEDTGGLRGEVSRLACKMPNTFAVWDVVGEVTAAKGATAIPSTNSGGIIQIAVSTPVQVTIKNIAEGREGTEIILYNHDASPPVYSISLGSLLSFGNGKNAEQLPQMVK